MKWKAIHKVRMVHFRESVVFGEKTTFVYGTVWGQGLGQESSVSSCTDLQLCLLQSSV